MLSLQLIASNTEGKSSPSEVLVCTTNPDKPGPPSAPCVTAATPYGFTVTWGKDIYTSELPQSAEGCLLQPCRLRRGPGRGSQM